MFKRAAIILTAIAFMIPTSARAGYQDVFEGMESGACLMMIQAGHPGVGSDEKRLITFDFQMRVGEMLVIKDQLRTVLRAMAQRDQIAEADMHFGPVDKQNPVMLLLSMGQIHIKRVTAIGERDVGKICERAVSNAFRDLPVGGSIQPVLKV
jgi:hypothetical protein